ncbi:MAG: hypothetical protein OEX09_05285 [Candidatus Bathyarchaeota archaeon]|nr:hypothetical protein [Candidatus Bathyarchaeota archaeon]
MSAADPTILTDCMYIALDAAPRWHNTSSQRERLDNRRRRSHKRTVPENAKAWVREWTYLHLRTGFGMQPVA